MKAGGIALALAGTAAFVNYRVRVAERAHPAPGRSVCADGVRLHYVEAGEGPPLVLLHGLGSMVEELMLSGLVHELAQRHRVIAIDRPGSGHSERPHRMRYTAAAQADLVAAALARLGAERPVLYAHSWGTLVALELALRHPGAVGGLVLASGLYYPSLRLDLPLLAPPALPLLGDAMARTVSPLLARLSWPAWLKLLFAPAPVPAYFSAFPTWLAVRPSQLRAVAEDAIFTPLALAHVLRGLPALDVPLAFVAGQADRYVGTRAHTQRLQRTLPRSRLFLSPHAGHMVHHTDLPLVLQAIESVAR